jgi:glycerol-3-phosphate dehydrogenase (NAD(P)+)
VTIRVGLLGGGSWGTAVGALAAHNAPVMIWARDALAVEEINCSHTNRKYLADAQLPHSLGATTNLGEAMRQADVVLVAIPAQGFRQVLEEARDSIRPWIPVVSLTKGLEFKTGKRMTEIVEELLPGHPVGALTGPNLAREVVAGLMAASVIAMKDEYAAKTLQRLLTTGVFRVYRNDDVIGCEVAGSLKNLIAIATGIFDGLGAGDNARAGLITRGLSEITRLGVAMGGKAVTFAGLAGVGDLVATCSSSQSRNRHVGVELAKGRHIGEIVAGMSMVAEGVKTAPAAQALAEAHRLELPILREVCEIDSRPARNQIPADPRRPSARAAGKGPATPSGMRTNLIEFSAYLHLRHNTIEYRHGMYPMSPA